MNKIKTNYTLLQYFMTGQQLETALTYLYITNINYRHLLCYTYKTLQHILRFVFMETYITIYSVKKGILRYNANMFTSRCSKKIY